MHILVIYSLRSLDVLSTFLRCTQTSSPQKVARQRAAKNAFRMNDCETVSDGPRLSLAPGRSPHTREQEHYQTEQEQYHTPH